MSLNDNSLPTEPRVILRTPGMNEVLPRRDLNLFTSSGTFPSGEWILSEFHHPHQFQAAYCVPDTQGQMVRAPMPLANVSAVTNQQEIYDHCTVYHYDPTYQRRDDTDHFRATAATGQQEQQLGNAFPWEHGNYQQASIDSQALEHRKIGLDVKQELFSPKETAAFASPPPYSSLAAARVQAYATPPEKRAENAQASMNGSATNTCPVENASRGHTSQQGLSIANGSFSSMSHHDSFQNFGQYEIHGLSSFALQDSFNSDIHGASFLSTDTFSMTLSPTMLSQLGEQTFDELYRQRSEANCEVGETQIGSIAGDLEDGDTLVQTTK